MTNAEWVEMLRLIPAQLHNVLVMMTNTGIELSVETIFRFEPTYLVMRGRLAGTNDNGRVFFVPYDKLTYANINRAVSENEIRAIYGQELVEERAELTGDSPIQDAESPQELVTTLPMNAPTPPPAPAATAPPPAPASRLSSSDTAAAAKTVLLERIRAARAGLTPPGRPAT
jgi:hypothetical protein